jgi:transposase
VELQLAGAAHSAQPRPLRTLVDAVLKELSPRFSRLYAKTGRPSVAPERLLRALLLQVLCCTASGASNWTTTYSTAGSSALTWMTPISDVSVFTKNRQRLLDGEAGVVNSP